MKMNNLIKMFLLLIVSLTETGGSLVLVDRFAQSSVLVDKVKRIYFFGGDTSNAQVELNQVVYLDLSKPFNTENPPFEELQNVIPFGSGYATASFDTRSNLVYLFGGIAQDFATKEYGRINSVLFSYSLETNKWSTPTTNGIEPNKRRREINGALDPKTGKFYIFGGITDKFAGEQNQTIFNDINIFDMTSLNWSQGSTLSAPLPRVDYTATLLDNGIIVFIGGREQYSVTNPLRDVDINQLSLYDTIADKWSSMTARGATLDSRNSHSAVLITGEKIVIFGGEKGNGVGTGGRVKEQLAVLNTKVFPYEWNIPQITNPPPPTLSMHSATVIGDYMFINFGNNSYPAPNEEVKMPFFYILDTRNFTWITQFDPEQVSTLSNITTPTSTNIPPTSGSDDSNLSAKKSNTGTIFGITGGCIGIIASIIGFLGYKFYGKRKQTSKPIPTAGSDLGIKSEIY